MSQTDWPRTGTTSEIKPVAVTTVPVRPPDQGDAEGREEEGTVASQGIGTGEDAAAQQDDALTPRPDTGLDQKDNSFSRLRRLAVKLEKNKSHRDFFGYVQS